MSSQRATTIATYAALSLAGTVSLSLPDSLPTISAQPLQASASVRLYGTIRDFHNNAPSLSGNPSGGNGHYAGMVAQTLGSDGQPAYAASGPGGGPMDKFNISNCALKPQEEYAAMFTVLGAAINSGTYDRPVTVRLSIGGQTVDPFGAFDKPVASNVNKAGNPRKFVHSSVLAKDTIIHVTGKSWEKKSSSYSGASESHWQTHHSFSTSTNTPQIKVLRDGDNVPSNAGFMGQLSAKQFVAEFVNTATNKMKLGKNQVIYLYELGVTNMSDPAADFQDLVILVTLGSDTAYLNTCNVKGQGGTPTPKITGYKVSSQWRDDASNPIAPHLSGAPSACGAESDAAGTKGAASTGGVATADAMAQWFNDTLGVNISATHPIDLVRNVSGNYEFNDPDFFPIDGMLLGNDGQQHNYYFTYSLTVEFVHDACSGGFFEFEGADDAWVFIDGKLAIDLGGVMPGTRQRIEVDRLGLSDGQTYELQLFYAQRNPSTSSFRVLTNLDLIAEQSPISMSSACD
jgi:fibro-slime domain-containing protein